MVSVASLLNPVAPLFEDRLQQFSPASTTCTSRFGSPAIHHTKKLKMSKDAAIFAKGKIKGETRYPPCNVHNNELLAQYMRFQLFPENPQHIVEYPRHIPYNSEKKSFLEKTGRESFEVFQYTFKVPGDDRDYTVMWDYNVGLVRITPFFKCCKYSKTTPAKMLNINPGLREICHSITGGALAAQGYWMPYEAAKAVAATFCFHIRYALTPVFGLDFSDLCVVPEDPSFGRMIIERNVIRQCTEAANEFRAMSREASIAISHPTPLSTAGLSKWVSKSLRPSPVKTVDMESGYGTDTDRSDKYLESPQIPTKLDWTALNIPRSAVIQQHHIPCSKETLFAVSAPESSEDAQAGLETSSEGSGVVKRALSELDEDYDGESSSAPSSEEAMSPPKRRKKSVTLTKEARAAYLLMQLNMADASLKDDGPKGLRRRASS